MWAFTHDFLKKVDLDLKMWTFYAWFSEKSIPRPENVDLLRMIFWKKWTSSWKCGPFTEDFLKKVDLNLKNVDLYAWFSEKSGPRLENVDLLRMIFWKRWTSTWRMWTFTHDFLKKVDLDLKMWTFYAWFSEKSGPWPENVDLVLKMWTFYAWFSEKGGPQPEKCGPLRMIFWKRWRPTWNIWTFYAWFFEKSGPRHENVDLLRMIFWKRWTST